MIREDAYNITPRKLDARHENKEYRTCIIHAEQRKSKIKRWLKKIKQRSENAAKANTVATKVLNQRSYDRTDKKMHFMIRIKGQKQESLKGQNQDYKKNITDDVYQR